MRPDPAAVAQFDQAHAAITASMQLVVDALADTIESDGLLLATAMNGRHVDELSDSTVRTWANVALVRLAQRKLADEGRTPGGAS